MAYIYRYQLRVSALRDSINLMQYSKDIESVLNAHFNKNLKDSFVKPNFFEFKLYATVSRGLLQEMGRKLKAKLAFPSGFIRMEQTLYALVYPPDNLAYGANENIVHIEFIDSMLLDNDDLFMQRAISFFDKNSAGSLSDKGYTNNIKEIIKNNYIDVLDAYIDKEKIPKILKIEKEISCFLIKGFHRHKEKAQNASEEYYDINGLLLEKNYDAGYIQNRKNIDGVENNRIDRTINLDYIEIHSLEAHSELIEKIDNELRLLLSPASEIYALSNISEDEGNETDRKYVFRVHNVGQALATSLSYENHSPFLYFDYGMPFGNNSFTKPARVNMITNPGTTIIISHVHKDHWFRIVDDFNAFQCNWFIPDQVRKKGLNHKLAEIIVLGGTVQLISSDIIARGGRLTYSGVSTHDPNRPAHHVHETGLSLRIEACDYNGNGLNILIAGDQRYDYMDIAQKNDLDILVASHHGGSYCWSLHDCVPNARATGSPIVIYSYGMGNTHHHPTNTADYNTAKWRQAHHTSVNGDYEITISFR